MLVSHNHKFIFIHIPKVAGTSVIHALSPYIDKDDSLWLKRIASRVRFFEKFLMHPPHLTVQQVIDRFGQEKYADYFKFAFVRNPWDWQVSLYHYMRQERRHFQHEIACQFKDFKEYLYWRAKPENARLQCEHVLDKDGNIAIDFIGKFESINDDFENVCEKIGISANLRHLNRSRHRNYMDYYDDESRDLIAHVFKDDIELFGYAFNSFTEAKI